MCRQREMYTAYADPSTTDGGYIRGCAHNGTGARVVPQLRQSVKERNDVARLNIGRGRGHRPIVVEPEGDADAVGYFARCPRLRVGLYGVIHYVVTQPPARSACVARGAEVSRVVAMSWAGGSLIGAGFCRCGWCVAMSISARVLSWRWRAYL